MINSPCLDCTDRVLGCHSSCERYREFGQELERVAKQREKYIKLYHKHIDGKTIANNRPKSTPFKCHKK